MSFVMSQIDHTKNNVDMFDTEVAKRVGLPLEDYRKKAAFEWWMTAEGAVKAGVADALVDELIYYYEEPQRRFSLFGFNHEREDRFGAWLCGPEQDSDQLCHDKYTGSKTY
jgi:hypothetical protein